MKRKIYDQLLLWKNKRKGKSAMMIEGLQEGHHQPHNQESRPLIPGPSGEFGNSAVCLYDPDATSFAIFTSDYSLLG